MRLKKSFKKGAASFYIVAFATLILMIIATSFAAVIISEVTRTSNDDLSQSAYDSAMAGIEDAKLAFYSYQNCKVNGGDNCENITKLVDEKHDDDCDMVAKILGRDTSGGGVAVQERKQGSNNMQQYYTCTKISTSLADYRATVSSTKVMQAKFDGVSADKIKKVKISWHSDTKDSRYSNFNYSGRGMFQSGYAVPPTISLAMVQTAGSGFKLSDFDMTLKGSRCPNASVGCTDRGTVFLVPKEWKSSASNNDYYKVASGENNYIDKGAFLDSNSKTKTNLPYVVKCREPGSDYEFRCSAEIELPDPIKSSAGSAIRNDDTFTFIVGVPYGQPETDFALEFYCSDGEACANQRTERKDDTEVLAGKSSNLAFLKSVQIEMDSTGRANDLFRRIVMRLENSDDYTLSSSGALELFEDGMKGKEFDVDDGEDSLVESEFNFKDDL